MLKLAVHYSPQMVALVDHEEINFDLFKCPAWPDILNAAQVLRPAYVHFPLRAGAGIGHLIDSETRRHAIWSQLETLMAHTATRHINVHLAPLQGDHPQLPSTSVSKRVSAHLKSALLDDLESVIRRYGADKVILENAGNDADHFHVALHPDLIRDIVETTGCGFLLNLAHAQLAARLLKIPLTDYLAALPVRHIREIHLSGVQLFDQAWVKVVRPHLPPGLPFLARYSGQWVDHLPMTEADWELFEHVLGQITSRAWGKPWVIAFEYSGIGPFWQAVTQTDVLRDQVRRLYAAVHPPAKVRRRG
ncbi:MAG: DUF692 family protein [bacterium]|nr:DUF692 family protein [bacterium]